MTNQRELHLTDTGERMIPTQEGEVSVVFSRHQFAYRYAQQFATGKDILDVGCGTGYGSKILSECANYVLGLDYDADAVDYCRANFNAPNIEFQQIDADKLELDREFDIAIAFQVIEHMHDVEGFVDHLKNIVKQNGLILITTPNVQTFHQADGCNPFHFSEMSFEKFERLISKKFNTYKILGISHESHNWLRSMIQKMPLYRHIGLMFKRNSHIKKVAVRAMDLTHYRIIVDKVAQDAIDLLAVCTNIREAV
jgi:2-polyprenyl-3-methyl-5-hydroxy-6-metoxy-1,4-benzoquinol methylase